MRSQMAEAFYNNVTMSHDATSAGAIADETKAYISPRATKVMDEIGIETQHMKPLKVTKQLIDKADKIIYFPSDFMPDYVIQNPKSELWDVVDPYYHKNEGIALVREVRNDIRLRVEELTRVLT